MREFAWVVMAMMALGLTACAAVDRPYIRYAVDSALAPPVRETVTAPSGETFSLYRLDTGPHPTSVMFFVSGSGCESLHYYMRSYFRYMPDVRVFAVQKTGVGPLSPGFKCSPEFYDHYDHAHLLQTNRLALAEVIRRYPGGIDGVMGVSEGGTLAAELAHDEPRIRRVAIIGSGGMTFGDELRLWGKKQGFTPDQAIDRAKATPDDITHLSFGLTHRYLASWVDFDPAPVYLGLTQRIVVFAGDQDRNVPIESEQYLLSRFQAAGKENYRLIAVRGAGHALIGDGVDHRKWVFPQIARFFATGQYPQ